MENRVCKFCEKEGKIVIEDEFHFLLQCPLYKHLREQCINRHYRDKPTYDSFISIMSSEDTAILVKLASFVFQANKLRENALKMLC